MVECTLVPISQEGSTAGLLRFSGTHDLTLPQESGIQILAYMLFAHTRSLRNVGLVGPITPLTPREKQVIKLVAEGNTAQEIADKLATAARTVNQHTDNVADKLGTSNSTQTVAEALRLTLLDE
jgi:DNA-binding CsgD family transcriptional regulator